MMNRSVITALGVIVILGLIGLGVYVSTGDAKEPQPNADQDSTNPPPSSSNVIEVRDALGDVYRFEEPPARIAALSAFSLEILMEMGVTPVARFEDPFLYPAEASGIPTVGRSHETGPDIEQLLAADPDAILLHWVYRNKAEEVSEQVGCPVLVLNISDIDAIRGTFELLAGLIGDPQKAEPMVEDLERTRAWLAAHQPAEGRPVALSLLGQEDTWYAHRDNHFMGSVLKEAGAVNAAGQDEPHGRFRSLSPIDLEMVIAKDPEVIFIMPYGDADQRVVIDNFNNHPATGSLRAVRNNRVHVLPYTMASQPGPRSGKSLRSMYKLIYPEQPGPDW